MFSSTSAHACLHRLTAVLGIALVLALNVLAVWPTGHTWLHHDESDVACPHGHTHESAPSSGGDSRDAQPDDCVIVKFAHGGAGLVVAPQFFFAPRAVRVAILATAPALAAALPAHLLPPGCGPPAV